MASEIVSSDHPSASSEVVEKKECEEVKPMAEVVSPLRETEEKAKVENSMVEEKSIEPPSSEEVTKIAEPEEKVVEKSKGEDASEATVPNVEPEEEKKAEDLTPPPALPEEKTKVEDLAALTAEPEEKVEVKPKTEDSTTAVAKPEESVEDKNAEVSSVAEQVAEYVESKSEEKVEVETLKKDAIEEIPQELAKKATDLPESSIDVVVKEEEDVKEALVEKESEATGGKDAETSEVEHIVIAEEDNSIIPPAEVIEEPQKDLSGIVVEEVVGVLNDKETCGDKIEGAEFSNEKAKDVIEEPEQEKTGIESEVKTEEKEGEETNEPIQVVEKEKESSEEKTEEIIKPGTEEITEAISSSEKADERLPTKVDVENKVENEVVATAPKGSASLGELLKPQTEEKEKEDVKADVEKEKTTEEIEKSDGVVKTEESTKDDDTNKETSKDAPVEDVPVTKSKQSSNILTKVKQSLVKAKKAIIGKSPSSKTPSSETKAEIKV